MNMKKSVIKRRIGAIISLFSLCSIVLIFEYYKIEHRDSTLLAIGIIPVIIFMLSFIVTYINTGLWKFIHKPLIKLDEREIALTSKSLRYSYGIFTVLVILLLLSLAITEIQIDVVIVASLILFAHILPATVIAWTEKVV